MPRRFREREGPFVAVSTRSLRWLSASAMWSDIGQSHDVGVYVKLTRDRQARYARH